MNPLWTLLFLLVGCHSEQPAGAVPEKPPVADSVGPKTTVQPAEGKREPNGEEVREFGLITEIEDGPYPFFSVTMAFPERNASASFTVNIEDIAQDSVQLNALRGRYASIYYIPKMEHMLMDLQYNGASVQEDGAPDPAQALERMTGVLSGADSVTAGDLPDVVSITDAQGRKIEFEVYVADSMVAVNGKTVTAFYYTRGTQIITYLESSEN